MRKTLLPEGWEPPKGYANGLAVSGTQWIFLGGQIGWNERQEFETDDFVGQVEQALRNVAQVLAVAGATPDQIVRMTWYITDRSAYLAKLKELGAVYRSVMGRHFPPMTVVEVSALIEERALVEIEATALTA